MLKRTLTIIRYVGGTPIQYLLLMISLLAVALLEVVGVSMIPAFIAVLASPDKALPFLSKFAPAFLQTQSTSQPLIVFSCVAMIIFFVLKNVALAIIGLRQARFIAKRQSELSKRLLAEFLSRPYGFHLTKNSSEIQSVVTSDASNVISGVIIPGAQLFTESLVVLLLVALLFVYGNFTATIIATVILGGCAMLFYGLVRSHVRNLGDRQQKEAIEMSKWIRQALGGIKEVKLFGRENFFLEAFGRHAESFASNSTRVSTIAQMPRYGIEALVVACMSGATLLMAANGLPTTEILPLLALFGIAAVRLIPSVNRILSALSILRSNEPSATMVLETLESHVVCAPSEVDRPTTIVKPAGIKMGIEVKSVDFTYPGADRPVLKSVSFEMLLGTMVGIVGLSGAGKSTLVDIILGLHQPTDGAVLVDGVDIFRMLPAWQRSIGYVPQSIFIADDSIRRNIAFGIKENDIDDNCVWDALRKARLFEFVYGMPEGLDTQLGEGGSRISGGQRQRIGIARSLYGNPSVLIMDEATSALDNATENEVGAVMQHLKGEKALIIVAHRLNTVKRCDRLLFLKDGRVAGEGAYQTLFDADLDFRRLMGELGHAAN